MYGHLLNTKINVSECVFKCFQFVSRESLTIKRCLPFEVRVTVGSPNSPRNPCSIDHPEKLFFLRVPQHIPGAYPQASSKAFLHQTVGWGSGLCFREMLEYSYKVGPAQLQIYRVIKGSLDEKLPSYELLKMSQILK